MSKLKLEQRVIGMVSTNVYLAINKETSECFLVDPADRADYIEDWIQQNKYTLKGILLTHGHFDHIGAVSELRKKYQVPVYCHESEKAILEDSVLNLSANWAGAFTAKCDIMLKDEEEFELAGFKIIAYHTPGHTKGGACYYLPEEEVLFSFLKIRWFFRDMRHLLLLEMRRCITHISEKEVTLEDLHDCCTVK